MILLESLSHFFISVQFEYIFHFNRIIGALNDSHKYVACNVIQPSKDLGTSYFLAIEANCLSRISLGHPFP